MGFTAEFLRPRLTSVTDSELIARVLVSDDRAAFGALVERHQSAVRRFLRHVTRGDNALADDLAQDTFIQAWQNLGRFHGGSAFSTWLLGIAHNLSRNARRRQNRERGVQETSVEPSVDSAARSSDLSHDLGEAMKLLTADEQLTLHLCYQQGLSHAEISVLLDWPLGTVKTQLARSKEKLRPLLAAWNPQT
jgi:RNA polymerase sigma factor (sigma-70 family)